MAVSDAIEIVIKCTAVSIDRSTAFRTQTQVRIIGDIVAIAVAVRSLFSLAGPPAHRYVLFRRLARSNTLHGHHRCNWRFNRCSY